MKFRFMLALLIVIMPLFNCKADLKDLEDEIRMGNSEEIKALANKIFESDKYNSIAIQKLMELYRFQDEKKRRDTSNIFNYNYNYQDTIKKFFKKLIDSDSNNPKPYLLQAYYQYNQLTGTDTARLAPLKIAWRLDSNNIQANLGLGETYHTLFYWYYNLSDKSRNLAYYATKSRTYLIKAIELEPSNLEKYKYLIAQYSYFLNDRATAIEHENMPIKNRVGYFPVYEFVELPENWRSDFTIDLLRYNLSNVYEIKWYSSMLREMHEKSLSDTITDKTIFRFTLLPSFTQPKTIRIEKSKDKISLFWKASSGHGGYDQGTLSMDSSRIISEVEWREFTSLINAIDFWNMKTESDRAVFDGSEWILEGVDNGKFHVISRISPEPSAYRNCCMYLLNLAGLKEH